MATKITIHHLLRITENTRLPQYIGERLKFTAPLKPSVSYSNADAPVRNDARDEFTLVAVEEWDGHKRVLHWAVEL